SEEEAVLPGRRGREAGEPRRALRRNRRPLQPVPRAGGAEARSRPHQLLAQMRRAADRHGAEPDSQERTAAGCGDGAMKELVELIALTLVDHPAKVNLQETERLQPTTLA